MKTRVARPMTGLFVSIGLFAVLAGLCTLSYKPRSKDDRICESCGRLLHEHCEVCGACPNGEDCNEALHALREVTTIAS